jgi:hypothetical protein
MPRPATIGNPSRKLIDGQHLDQPTFHDIYEAMPPGTRAELMDGVVYIPSPASHEHSTSLAPVIIWLGDYSRKTDGVKITVNGTAILGKKSEVQPDAALAIAPEFGGRTKVIRGFVHGGPELVVEVSKATRHIDLGPKLAIYQAAGVLEYIVRAIDPDEIHWFRLVNGVMERQSLDSVGLYRSTVFPGLWLDAQALIAEDLQRLQDLVFAGCDTPEHADFVAKLALARAAR